MLTARGVRYPKNTQSEPYDRQDAEILVADFANKVAVKRWRHNER